MEDVPIKKLLTLNAVLFVLLLMFAACDGGSDGGDTSPGPTNPPPTSAPDDFETMMLGLINDARAVGRDCGDTFFPAAPPLKWDDRVAAAAEGHSEDMADNQFFDHEGSDGSDTGDRLMNEGYDPSAWGEAILVGIENESRVVDSFLDSPEHCSILMDPTYEDVGVGFARGNYKGRSTLYWTFDLATEKN
ncbi:MAG TPA: CAP domain-containing protein [Thermodesulfobacteriota bacterium]|nr:CAP domain-containing protein [Thermodesulfobacteriota bacterium]